jgi:uncharacterized protein YcfL
MKRTIAVFLAVVALAGCAKHDTKAQEEREQTLMMQRLLEAAGQREPDAGLAPPAASAR